MPKQKQQEYLECLFQLSREILKCMAAEAKEKEPDEKMFSNVREVTDMV